MKGETIGELNIILSDLSNKLDGHMQASREGNENLKSLIEELGKTCDLTLQQAIKTNGRVNIVEPLALDYQENRARIRGAVTLIALMGTVIIAGVVLLGKLYIDKAEQNIAENVVQTLENTYFINK